MSLVGPIIVLGMGLGALGVHLHAYRAWRRTADRLGLSFSEESFWGDWEIYGEIRGCRVRVENLKSRLQRNGRYTRITVVGSGRISTGISLKSESILTAARKVIEGEDVLVGDAEFDARVHMKGRDEVLLAVLDARTRGTVRRFFTTWRGEVTGGEVLRDARTVIRRASTLERLILDAVRLAESVQAPEGGYWAALLANLERDPEVGVRRRCLGLLLGRDGPTRERAIQIALGDADAGIRFQAAAEAGPPGYPVLEALLDEPTGAVGVQALERLVAVEPAVGLSRVMGIINGAPARLTAVALRIAGEARLRQLLARIQHLAGHPDAAIAAAAADALGGLGDPASEGVLVRQLEHLAPAVREHAATALGEVGTLAAVQPLLAAAAQGGLKAPARAAIQRIQGRHARAGAGALAVVREAQAGQLALGPEAGQVGLVDD
ncbi:MAG: HEAT repeat domain-containing protein [Myxococcales bacterium]|nr:HEAT repeat domain-containing protein [Myxococcales bacterium]